MTNYYLRMDDVGASTKKYEVYSNKRFGNFLFFKYLNYFKAWGVYDELSSIMWEKIINILKKNDSKLTVGITASWVERSGNLVPFYEKFPKQAHILSIASKEGYVEIANHGLTHCVVGKHLPRLFSSNRKYHREFWSSLPRDIHFEHLEKSQNLFKNWLGTAPNTLIPPGNVMSIDTINAAEKYGIKVINCTQNISHNSDIRIINDERVIPFHDRELSLYGVDWLERLISAHKGSSAGFLRDI